MAGRNMLETQIKQQIKEKGPLPQSRFMELALKAYYSGEASIGQDFTTAPEVSQLFGELIGLWTLDLYQQLGSPEKILYVELGPGRGTLMKDILRVAKLSPPFLKALDIHFVEFSPRLKKLQQQALPGIPVTWHESFETIPSSSAPLLIVANEFFDALPAAYYLRKKGILYERCVDVRDGELIFAFQPLREGEGADTSWEESADTMRWVRAIFERLKAQTGAFLCFDYGYEKGEGETLQALFEGTLSSPLQHIGASDMSFHVNFGLFRREALEQGISVWGPLSQGLFLNRLNIKQRVESLQKQNPTKGGELEAAYARLTHPLQMGLLFKALAMTSPSSLLPLGFNHYET